jgi:hypothetical protein
MTNERQGKPKCTKDKELWKPEKRVERKGDSIFQATRASKLLVICACSAVLIYLDLR